MHVYSTYVWPSPTADREQRCGRSAVLSNTSGLAARRVRRVHSLQEDSDAEREAALVVLVQPLAVLEPARSKPGGSRQGREGRARVGRGLRCASMRGAAGRRAHCCRQDVASSELTLGWQSRRLLCAAISSISLSSLESISSSCRGAGARRVGWTHGAWGGRFRTRVVCAGGGARSCGRGPARPCRGWCPA